MAIVRQIGILALLAVLATGGYVGWQEWFGTPADARQDSRAEPRKRSVIVETEAAEFRDIETLVDAIGSTRARRAVEITPLADGRVVAINFRAGQSVEAGEPLLRLDDLSLLAVELSLPESLFGWIERGQSIKADARPIPTERSKAPSKPSAAGSIRNRAPSRSAPWCPIPTSCCPPACSCT